MLIYFSQQNEIKYCQTLGMINFWGLNNMIPPAIYKVLPILYLTLGMGLILFFESDARWMPGLFFIASALMVIRWRLQSHIAKQHKTD